jgi:hypothetical protein
MPTDTTRREERHVLKDKQGRSYQMVLVDEGSFWISKVRDGQVCAAEAACRVQGSDLILENIHVQEAAKHPMRGLARLKGWFRFDVQGRTENYRHRGLAPAILDVLIQRARIRGFKRVVGKLAPIDLQKNPDLPDWYRRRGFHVTMEADQLAGKLEFALR